MIFIDTNVLVDFFFVPGDQANSHRLRRVSELFEAISVGEVEALLSEVVIHETFYVLVIRGKHIDAQNFCSLLSEMLTWPGWAISDSEKGIYLHALDILEENPKLEFSDAVIATRAEAHGAQLATFDRRLAEAFGGPIWMDS